VSLESSIHAKAVELSKSAIRMTTTAGSGHPSSAMSLAHIVVALMYRRMRYDPADPWDPNCDRLVLSEGHAVPIIYAAYADLGGAVGDRHNEPKLLKPDDLSALRELDSELDGHPNPAEGFPFFDAATGSLGQGLSVGAGLALAARLDGINKSIFVLIGDGESREGQIWEAADFTVDHQLSSVCAIVNCNGHGQAAPVSRRQSPEVIADKLRAFGWDVKAIDGHDPAQIVAALENLGSSEKPVAIVARTIKGWGVPSIIGKNYHGKPIPEEDVDAVLAELDATAVDVGAKLTERFTPQAPPAAKARPKPTEIRIAPFAEGLERVGLSSALKAKKLATRVAYGAGLVALGDADDRIVALDADVSNSTYSMFFKEKHPDRYFECRIAEQNMISVAAGLSAAGKIPFVSSFGKFIARATDQIDLASITRANLKIVASHTGVSLGADGPSQMAVADLAYFRSMTRVDDGRGGIACRVFHPSDAVCSYRCCELMANVRGMCYLRTHRPATPFIYSFDERFELGGCKQLCEGRHLTLASSGYMLTNVLTAAEKLAKAGITCNVFDCYTFPLDATPILSAARDSGGVILTVEDNYAGGLHAELAEAAARQGNVRVDGLTVSRIPKSAKTAEEVFTHVGVGLGHIIQRARDLVGC
jgi:transketolase